MLKKIWFHSFIDSFKFLCMSDKPRLYQLNIITSSRSTTVQASLTARIFSYVRGNTVKEGEIPYVEKKYKTSPTYQIKHAKISYSIVSLVFRKFSYRTYWNGLNQSTSKLRYSKYLKKYELC